MTTSAIIQHIAQTPDFTQKIVKPTAVDTDTLTSSTAARLIWSIATEPGDQIAGALTAALGPEAALELLLASSSEKAFLQATHRTLHNSVTASTANPQLFDDGEEALLGEYGSKHLGAAWRRWKPRIEMIPYVSLLKVAKQHNLTLLTPEHSAWPTQLGLLGDSSPQTLWVKGDHRTLSQHGLAVVGARAITRYGEEVTAELTRAAAAAGATIISGAAYGVDAVAHRVAMQANALTIAILAGGCDRPYPMAHATLLAEISRHGAVCSEVPPGTAPTRWRFLQRNRIIAALSQATLVTEAGLRSGAINTAGHTAEIGNPLGAVPGPITSPASTGCHRLIREYNAEVITNGPQVRALAGLSEVISDQQKYAQSHVLFEADNAPRPPSHHVRVLDSLPLRGRLNVRQISQRSGLHEKEVTRALAEMELVGSVKSLQRAEETLWALAK